jgi:hypothetical protein
MSIFSQPHVWTVNDTVTAALLNGNDQAYVNAGNAINNQNIDSAGIYASQIKPTNAAQATFGSVQPYTFPAALTVTGNIQNTGALNAFSSAGDLQVAPTINALNVLSRVPPMYTATGAQVAATAHMVFGTLTLAASSGATITLTNNAVFTSGATYSVFVTFGTAAYTTIPAIWAVASAQTATSFAITIYALNGSNFIGSGYTGTLTWVAIGT